jgi:hypothetical protein
MTIIKEAFHPPKGSKDPSIYNLERSKFGLIHLRGLPWDFTVKRKKGPAGMPALSYSLCMNGSQGDHLAARATVPNSLSSERQRQTRSLSG